MILGFSVGYEVQEKHGDGADQDNVNVAAFMQRKLQNEPKNQQSNANYATHICKPFYRSLRICSDDRRVTSASNLAAALRTA